MKRLLLISMAAFPALCWAGSLNWQHLSTAKGDLPLPGPSTEQTGAVVADFDQDGTNEFVVSFRKVAPALVCYRRAGSTWARHVIEPDFLTVEAGGAVYDIDGDGDLDLVFGGDWQSDEVWWWENPKPAKETTTRWTRRLIKKGGAKQHHDQAFGDFFGTGKASLAFWNQGAKKIWLADIPADPANAKSWPLKEIFSGDAGEAARAAFRYPEGMSVFDVDGDGTDDLLAGNLWFKQKGDARLLPIQVAPTGGLIFAGKFKPGRFAQIVIAPGDGTGRVRLYECRGNPENTSDWFGRDLIDREVIHGHSLQVADLNGDGNLDIFVAEMAKWSRPNQPVDNPGATAWILYGDGKGNFRTEVFVTGMGFHEARVADLNGDGKLDILSKPYTWEAPRIDIWLQVANSPAQ